MRPSTPLTEESTLPLSTLLCADERAVAQLGPTIRRLAIGLLDQAVAVRLLVEGDDVQEVATGSLEVLQHRRSAWPFAAIQRRRVLDAVSERPPSVIHALSPSLIDLCQAIAEHVDAELVVQLSTAEDCRIALSSGVRADAWIIGSRFLQDLMRPQASPTDESVYLIHPGVPVRPAVNCFADDEQEPTLLCAAPLEENFGVERLLSAMGLLHGRGIKPLLFLWGEGASEANYRQFVNHHALGEQVTFAHPIGELADAMEGADLYLRPNSDVGVCMDVLQAMGHGLAVMCPARVGCDSVQPDITTITLNPGSIVDMADALQRAITERAATRAIAQRGLDYVRANHTVSGMAERTARLYHQLVSRHATIRLKE